MSKATAKSAGEALYKVSHILMEISQVQHALTAVSCLSRMEGIHQSEFAEQLKRDDLAALLEVLGQHMNLKVNEALELADDPAYNPYEAAALGRAPASALRPAG